MIAPSLSGVGKLFELVRPPRPWVVPVILASGIFSGLGLLIVHLSRAPSYLSNDPRACLNCHVMAPQFATWERGSHARVAVCNDCHVPHDSFARAYAFKASDGSRHAFMFTFRLEPQVIRVRSAGIRVIQENCIRCHQNLLAGVPNLTCAVHPPANQHLCWDCHRETPHGQVASLAAVPDARLPEIEKPLPEWIERFLRQSNRIKKEDAAPPASLLKP